MQAVNFAQLPWMQSKIAQRSSGRSVETKMSHWSIEKPHCPLFGRQTF
jgi:hypothetical protein